MIIFALEIHSKCAPVSRWFWWFKDRDHFVVRFLNHFCFEVRWRR